MTLVRINSVYTATIRFNEDGSVLACQKVPRVHITDDGVDLTSLQDPVDIDPGEVVKMLTAAVDPGNVNKELQAMTTQLADLLPTQDEVDAATALADVPPP